jgi:ribosome-associated toxin RatA of RatAB toxin-antitoxin module
LTVIDQSALLPYSATQIFELVNDIGSYPEFMEGCLGAKVLESSEEKVIARLELGKAGLRYSFTTSNTLNPPEKMAMALVEGPFRHFVSTWTFKALNESACKVSLHMEFEFSAGLLDTALKLLFENTSRSLVNAICKRADVLYGN